MQFFWIVGQKRRRRQTMMGWQGNGGPPVTSATSQWFDYPPPSTNCRGPPSYLASARRGGPWPCSLGQYSVRASICLCRQKPFILCLIPKVPSLRKLVPLDSMSPSVSNYIGCTSNQCWTNLVLVISIPINFIIT